MTKNPGLSTFIVALSIAGASATTWAADAAPVLDLKTPCEKPQYPRASLVNEETGTVTLAFLIATDGNVLESKVEKSSGFKNLDKAAINALGKCKFKPGTKDGKPEQAWTNVSYVWKLQ